MRGVVKKFPNTYASNGVDFTLESGKIHSLLGENGAGKTTLMRILSGSYAPDAGEIRITGKRVVFHSPRDALDHGIGMIHQHFQLVENFTVTENISLGMPTDVHLDMGALEKQVREFSDRYGLSIDSRAHIRDLSVGQQQRVEILRMLFRRVNILIMDEPTAVLSPQEITRLFATMRRIRDEGRSIVFITHKLEEVVEISDTITILRRGKVVRTVHPDHLSGWGRGAGTELARMMVGREVIFEIQREPVKTETVLLEVENLSVKGDLGEPAVSNLSFSIRKGEVFSVLCFAGNGQRALVEALMGLRPVETGRILFKGRPISESYKKIAYVPEDRTGRGSIADMSILENFILTRTNRFKKGPLLQWRRARDTARKLAAAHKIAASGLDMKAGQLSGGNLQKLILAREFSRKSSFLIAEQPTRGLDIGATEEIWQSLLKQRIGGAVMLVSGDIREVLSLSDTILVLFRGGIMDILSTDDENCRDKIGPLMAGVKSSR
jgi:general nucleoside transport system ATP-binding protein